MDDLCRPMQASEAGTFAFQWQFCREMLLFMEIGHRDYQKRPTKTHQSFETFIESISHACRSAMA